MRAKRGDQRWKKEKLREYWEREGGCMERVRGNNWMKKEREEELKYTVFEKSKGHKDI